MEVYNVQFLINLFWRGFYILIHFNSRDKILCITYYSLENDHKINEHLSKTELIETEHYNLHEGRICCSAVVSYCIGFPLEFLINWRVSVSVFKSFSLVSLLSAVTKRGNSILKRLQLWEIPSSLNLIAEASYRL